MEKRVLWVAVLLLLTSTVFAVDQVVTSAGDSGGSTQLRAKLAALQSSGGGTLTFSIGTATVVLAQGPLPAITSNSTIDGGGKITIDAASASTIFSVSSGATLTLKNTTLTNGYNGAGDGGAITNSGTLIVDQCTFTNNKTSAGFNGGAISFSGPVTITNSEFGANSAGNGGALYAASSSAVAQIIDCNFHDNSALNTTSGWGGAILAWNGAPVTITSSTFTSNSARFGGAIYVLPGAALSVTDSALTENSAAAGGGAVFLVAGAAGSLSNTQVVMNSISSNLGTITGSGGGAIYSAGPFSLTDCTVSDNDAGVYDGGALNIAGGVWSAQSSVLTGNSGSNGGGVQISGETSSFIGDCTISGNTAAVNGGGINNAFAGGSLAIMSSTVSGNSAGSSGGGISNGNALSLTNSTISGNTAGATGGGIFLSSNNSLPSAHLVNVTLANHSATNAGGIFHSGGSQSGNITLLNTIVAQNNGGNLIRGTASGGSIQSSGHNLSDDDSGDAFLMAAGDKSGSQFTANLGPLADNGGTTQTQVPGPGSAAIDAGTASGAPTTDQRGVTRPQGVAFDIGAVEVAGTDSSKLANISTRLDVETGDNVLIGGIIISGTTPKRVLIRAIGSSLPLNGALADPVLELHDANTLLETNDNWVDSPNKQEIIDTTIAPTNNAESAIIRTLPANGAAYTAIVRGANDSTGIALVEVYDLDSTGDARLANISTRGLVQTGDNVMIGGFIVVGPIAETVLIRAIGPSLPLEGTLADPTLEFHDENGDVITNDNWRDTQEAQIFATGIAPTKDAESAILCVCMPGAYTAIVRGVNDTSGVALIEAYEIK